MITIAFDYHFGDRPLTDYVLHIEPCKEDGTIIYGGSYCEEEGKYLSSFCLYLHHVNVAAFPANGTEALKMTIDNAKFYFDYKL